MYYIHDSIEQLNILLILNIYVILYMISHVGYLYYTTNPKY